MTRILYIPAALALLSGAAYGLHETLLHHYSAFAAMFPNAGEWWNPALSWKLKYAGGIPDAGPAFPGSTTVLVFLTDAYHLFGSIHRITLLLSGMAAFAAALDNAPDTHNSRTTWLWVIGCGAGAYAIFAAGFHLVYSLLF